MKRILILGLASIATLLIVLRNELRPGLHDETKTTYIQSNPGNETSHPETRMPFDENNYPDSQILSIARPITRIEYHPWIDSLSNQSAELHRYNLPPERLIVLSNTWLLESLASGNPALKGYAQETVIEKNSLINIPDRITAHSLFTTLRKSFLEINLRDSVIYLKSDSDTLFRTRFTLTDNSIIHHFKSRTGYVQSVHRRTCFPECRNQQLLPCLELFIGDESPHLLVGCPGNLAQSEITNLLSVKASDIWMLYYLAPPGAAVHIGD